MKKHTVPLLNSGHAVEGRESPGVFLRLGEVLERQLEGLIPADGIFGYGGTLAEYY